MKHQDFKRNFYRAALGIALAGALTGIAFAQNQDNNSNGGWRRFDPSTQPNGSGGGVTAEPDPQAAPAAPPPASPPSEIVIPAGTWVTVRVNEPISSKHNHTGDLYSATLSQPLIADGYVIARRGQTVSGRVADVDAGGHVKASPHLSLELTDLTLVDGQPIPVRTELARFEPGSTKGRDAAAIVTTTGVGAAIGAAVGGGVGAAAGAGIGAIASAGVITSRGKETVVFPEDLLTFRTTAPITVSTAPAPQAFLPVQQSDYNQRPVLQRPGPYGYPYGPYGYPYGPYAYGPYPYAYPYYYGPGFYGPYVGFGFYGRFGRRF